MRRIPVLLATMALVAALSGCLVVEDSPAPGCRKYIGLPLIGGCAGRSIISDVALDPPVPCLVVEVNNCNGGVLDIRNDCADTLELDGVAVTPGDTATLDAAPADGGFTLVDVASNFANYVPDTDQTFAFTGKLGSQDLTLRFTKTAPLCEE